MLPLYLLANMDKDMLSLKDLKTNYEFIGIINVSNEEYVLTHITWDWGKGRGRRFH